MNLEDDNLDRQWLLCYVLGELSQDETRIADERFFSDDSFAMAVEETYRDLLDDYAANASTGTERERVQRAFFSGPHHRRQFSVLQAMQSLLQKPAIERETAIPPSRPRLLSFWPLAVSACALSLAVALIVFVHSRESRRASDRQTPGESASVKPAEPHAPVAPPSSAPAATTPQAAESAFTILLLPDVTRGNESTQTFSVPPSTVNIKFQIVLPGGISSAGTFDVRVNDANSNVLRFRKALPVRKLDTQAYIEFAVPSTELPAGEYLVDVFTSSAAKRRVAHFSVRVARGAGTQVQP
jgi:hypothetical protein